MLKYLTGELGEEEDRELLTSKPRLSRCSELSSWGKISGVTLLKNHGRIGEMNHELLCASGTNQFICS